MRYGRIDGAQDNSSLDWPFWIVMGSCRSKSLYRGGEGIPLSVLLHFSGCLLFACPYLIDEISLVHFLVYLDHCIRCLTFVIYSSIFAC